MINVTGFLAYVICNQFQKIVNSDTMTLRRPELITAQTVEKDYKNYKLRLSFEVVAIQFLLTEAREYGAQIETIALLEKSIENFTRINEIEFNFKKDGN